MNKRHLPFILVLLATFSTLSYSQANLKTNYLELDAGLYMMGYSQGIRLQTRENTTIGLVHGIHLEDEISSYKNQHTLSIDYNIHFGLHADKAVQKKWFLSNRVMYYNLSVRDYYTQYANYNNQNGINLGLFLGRYFHAAPEAGLSIRIGLVRPIWRNYPDSGDSYFLFGSNINPSESVWGYNAEMYFFYRFDLSDAGKKQPKPI